jgi:hypothetical protein
MKQLLFLTACLVGLAAAHPDHGIKPGPAPDRAVVTGNGEWSYEVVPGWGALPDGKNIGPTHGGVLVGPDGRVYMSTNNEMSILVWEADGRFVKSIAPECRGFHAMQIREEQGRAVIYGAQLKVNDPAAREKRGLPATPSRICKIGLDGELLLEIPNAATAEVPGGWKGLTAVAVAPDGAIFAATGYGAHMIHKFDAAGKLLKSFGGKGAEPGKFNTPHGLAIDTRFGDPRLLVVDRGNRRLCHLDLEGNWIGVHSSGLRLPCAVVFSGKFVVVAELEARVTVLDEAGFPVAFIGDNPDRSQWARFPVKPENQRPGIFTAPHGLALGADGALYVQDWNATGRITKLRKR